MTRRTRLLRFVLLALLVSPLPLLGDAGVLIPSGSSGPDPSILSLDQMAVDIRIDNGDARVSIRQVFASHRAQVLEGEYLFSMPSRATLSDFAVWDGVTRIPGVILERRRAEELYESLKQQQIDPGLLQQGESGTEGASEAARTSVFSARIVPIPGYGTKRLELEYHETVPVDNLKSAFAVPLRPDAYNPQSARLFSLSFSLASPHAIRDFRVVSRAYPLQIRQQTPAGISGSFSGRDVTFSEDFSVEYALDPARADALAVLTYRNPAPGVPDQAGAVLPASSSEPGFFQASALVAPVNRTEGGKAVEAPRTVIALFDTSLSMQWDKLERSFETLETLLRSLRRTDRFNLLLFNSETTLSGAGAGRRRHRRGRAGAGLRPRRTAARRNGPAGGARRGARSEPAGHRRSLHRGAERRERDPGDDRQRENRVVVCKAPRAALAAAERPRTYLFGVGDEANVPLLRMLSRDDGLMEVVRSTEPIAFKMRAFVSKIGARPLEKLQLIVDPPGVVDFVYPLDTVSFAGSVASWVGQYGQPADNVVFTAGGLRDGRPLEMRTSGPLPAESLEHSSLPRTWARARVDALLDKIARDGEDRASVDEIIRLSRKYKFVTPYTSFLAAPRALLRPRVIKPGDPVLRVATDESITSVVAMFPFGLVKKLRYLPEEQIWQTRFLAPVDMSDGTYQVRLVMRDQAGRAYREAKSFRDREQAAGACASRQTKRARGPARRCSSARAPRRRRARSSRGSTALRLCTCAGIRVPVRAPAC